MARRFELEPGTEGASGDKESALFSIAVSQRRQAHALERLAAVAERAEEVGMSLFDLFNSLRGPEGAARVAAYAERIRLAVDTDDAPTPPAA